MAEQIWHLVSNSGTFLSAAAILFFTGKGLLWLVLPGLVIRRMRNRSIK